MLADAGEVAERASSSAADEPDDLRTIEETARFFDVSTPTVRKWVGDGCPVWRSGRNGVGYQLSLRAVHAWREDLAAAEDAERDRRVDQETQLRLELLGGEDLGGAGIDAALSPKQRAEALQAELARTKLAKERGELVRADAMQLAIAGAFQRIGQRLAALPDDMAAGLGWSEEERAACAALVDQVREDLARELEGLETVDDARAA